MGIQRPTAEPPSTEQMLNTLYRSWFFGITENETQPPPNKNRSYCTDTVPSGALSARRQCGGNTHGIAIDSSYDWLLDTCELVPVAQKPARVTVLERVALYFLDVGSSWVVGNDVPVTRGPTSTGSC